MHKTYHIRRMIHVLILVALITTQIQKMFVKHHVKINIGTIIMIMIRDVQLNYHVAALNKKLNQRVQNIFIIVNALLLVLNNNYGAKTRLVMMMLAQKVAYYYKILKNVVPVQNVQKDIQRLKVRMNVNQNSFVMLINMQKLMVRHVSKTVVNMFGMLMVWTTVVQIHKTVQLMVIQIQINKLNLISNV